MKSQISRRALLATFSGIACAGYFKGLLRDAFAQEAQGPQRLIVLSNPHGCGADLWRPQAMGGGAAQETGWTLDYDPDSTLGWCDDQTEFEFGIDLLLDGLDRLRPKRR